MPTTTATSIPSVLVCLCIFIHGVMLLTPQTLQHPPVDVDKGTQETAEGPAILLLC